MQKLEWIEFPGVFVEHSGCYMIIMCYHFTVQARESRCWFSFVSFGKIVKSTQWERHRNAAFHTRNKSYYNSKKKKRKKKRQITVFIVNSRRCRNWKFVIKNLNNGFPRRENHFHFSDIYLLDMVFKGLNEIDGPNILYRNVHPGPRQGKEPGLIVPHWTGLVPCTHPGPVPM